MTQAGDEASDPDDVGGSDKGEESDDLQAAVAASSYGVDDEAGTPLMGSSSSSVGSIPWSAPLTQALHEQAMAGHTTFQITPEQRANLRQNLMQVQSRTSHHHAYLSARHGGMIRVGEYVKVLKGTVNGSLLLEEHLITVTGDAAYRVVAYAPPHISIEVPDYGQLENPEYGQMQRYKAEWQLIDYCQPVPVHYQDPTPIPMYPYAPRVLYVGTSLSAGSTFDKATSLERHLMDYFQRDAIDRSFVQGTSMDGSVRGCFPEDHGAYHTYHAICFMGCNNLSDILGGCEPEHITDMLHSLRTRLMPLDQVEPCICFIETDAWHLANQGAGHPADSSADRPITAGSSVSYVTPEHYCMQMLRLPGCDWPSEYKRFTSELLRLHTLVPAILYSVNGCAYLGPFGKSPHTAEAPVPPEYKNLCFAKSHYYNLSHLPWSSDIWGSQELETASRWRHQLGECPHGANMENHNQSKMLAHLKIVSAMVDRQAGEIKLVGKRHHLGTDADELISLVELVRPGHIESYFLLREEAGRMIGKAELDEIAGSLGLPIIYSSSRRGEPLGADEGDISQTGILAHETHGRAPEGRNATPPIVSLEGSIGVGKTTLLRSLKQMYLDDRSVVFVEEPVDEWVRNGFLSRLYTDPTTGPAFQAMVLTCMVCDLLKALSLEPTPRLIIMERSPQGNLNVFAKANLCKADLEMIQVTFDRLMTILPEDMEVTYLYLRATEETLMRRINERNRPAEANMPSAYIALLGVLHEKWLKPRCAGRPRTYVLDANADARAVFDHVRQLPIFAYDHQANPTDDGPPLGLPGRLAHVLAPAFVLPPGVTAHFPYSGLPSTPPQPWSISSCYPPTDAQVPPPRIRLPALG